MSDLKSKLPDLSELGSMAGKLYNDLKASVVEIIDDYKKKHPNVPESPKANVDIHVEVKTKVEKPAKETKKEE